MGLQIKDAFSGNLDVCLFVGLSVIGLEHLLKRAPNAVGLDLSRRLRRTGRSGCSHASGSRHRWQAHPSAWHRRRRHSTSCWQRRWSHASFRSSASGRWCVLFFQLEVYEFRECPHNLYMSDHMLSVMAIMYCSKTCGSLSGSTLLSLQ